jgi:hypothetical protein
LELLNVLYSKALRKGGLSPRVIAGFAFPFLYINPEILGWVYFIFFGYFANWSPSTKTLLACVYKITAKFTALLPIRVFS